MAGSECERPEVHPDRVTGASGGELLPAGRADSEGAAYRAESAEYS